MAGLIVIHSFNPLPTNDAYICVMSSLKPIRLYMGGLILGVNTLYRFFCFSKLFPMVGKGLMVQRHGTSISLLISEWPLMVLNLQGKGYIANSKKYIKQKLINSLALVTLMAFPMEINTDTIRLTQPSTCTLGGSITLRLIDT